MHFATIVAARLALTGYAMKQKEYSYRIQHACFSCRKAFKFDYLSREQRRKAWLTQKLSGRRPCVEFTANPHVCPQCSGPVHMMGRAFRAPKTENVDAWEAAEFLFLAGYRFWCSGRQLPTTAKGAKKFVADHPLKSESELLAERIKSTHS